MSQPTCETCRQCGVPIESLDCPPGAIAVRLCDNCCRDLIAKFKAAPDDGIIVLREHQRVSGA